MRRSKNNKGVIVLLIVVVMLLSMLCFLFATGIISFKSHYVDSNINEDVNCEDDIAVDYSKLTDMGTGIYVKDIAGFNYQLVIDSNGNLSYQNKEDGTKGTINIKNVVDVVYNQYSGEEKGEYFILTDVGELYTITEDNINSNTLDPIKVVTVDQVLKIGRFSTCKPGSGCGWGIYCVTVDGVTKQLVFQSV